MKTVNILINYLINIYLLHVIKNVNVINIIIKYLINIIHTYMKTVIILINYLRYVHLFYYKIFLENIGGP